MKIKTSTEIINIDDNMDLVSIELNINNNTIKALRKGKIIVVRTMSSNYKKNIRLRIKPVTKAAAKLIRRQNES